MRSRTFLLLALSCPTAACIGAADGADQEIGVDVGGAGKADSAQSVLIKSSKTVKVYFTAEGGPLDVKVDCSPSNDPDTRGLLFSVRSSALGIPTYGSAPARAGYFQWRGEVEAGDQTLWLRGRGGSGSCSVAITQPEGECTSASAFHSRNLDHTHLVVGTTADDWEDFPASGNHWGAWAPWNTVYERPVYTGFLLHNLEHGGLVLSYDCSSPTESDDCAAAESDLVDLANAFGQPRLLVTPDPSQPTRYAIRGWRWAYTADCLDAAEASVFMAAHYRHGREDVDADPPIPYDPTTLDVPCQDLMAAPDSCN